MGTRNLTCVIQGGEFRVAQYGQWDGYPEGAGRDILQFLNIPGAIDKLRARIPDLVFVADTEWNRRMNAVGIGDSIVCGSVQEKQYQRDFWQLDRNVGRKILNAIITTEGTIELMDSRAFAHDSLFCEWAYVVDLDRNVLEVYKGFNHDSTANAGVFANVPRTEEVRGGASGDAYYSVALVGSYPFDNLPTVEVMKEQCDPEEPEED